MILFPTSNGPYFMYSQYLRDYIPPKHKDYVDWGVERMFEQLIYKLSLKDRCSYIKTL